MQTITPKEIQASGAVTVADFLRDAAANSANSWGEGQSGNFAAGAAGIALRGLSEKYTLVLVDGQRVAPYAFFSNSVDSFFDLNTIPLNDIERIEIVNGRGVAVRFGRDRRCRQHHHETQFPRPAARRQPRQRDQRRQR